MQEILKGKECLLRVNIADVVAVQNASKIDTHIISPSGAVSCVPNAYDELERAVLVQIDGALLNELGAYSADMRLVFDGSVIVVPAFAFAEVVENAEPCGGVSVVDVVVEDGEVKPSEDTVVEIVSRKEFDALAKSVTELEKDKADKSELEELRQALSGVSADLLMPTTYAELKALRDAGELIPGMMYRITDFVTGSTQANTRSAEHPFDIIVLALNESTLSEDAYAIRHEGDTYFSNCNLAAWKLRYNFDNDTNKYKWAKKWVDERPASWVTNWGVLEEKYDNGASTNYTTAVVDGVTMYLYAPADRGNYLNDKTFYRKVGGIVIDSYEDFIYESDNAPYDEGDDYWNWYDVTEIRVKTASGQLIATLYNDSDDRFVDRNLDDMGDYPIYFAPNAREEDGKYYFTPYYGVDEWWYNVMGGEFETYDKEYFNGSKDTLYYAFTSVLPKYGRTVQQVYSADTKMLYYSDDLNDTVMYTSYIAPVEGHKGVIYRMIDENGNDLPFDFKNIQFSYNGTWHYPFSISDSQDNSLVIGRCEKNIVSKLNYGKLPVVIFRATSSSDKQIGNVIDVVVTGTAFIGNRNYGNRFISSDEDAATNYSVQNITTGDRCTGNTFYGGFASINIPANFQDNVINGARKYAASITFDASASGGIGSCVFNLGYPSTTTDPVLYLSVGNGLRGCRFYGVGRFALQNSSGSQLGCLYDSEIRFGEKRANVVLRCGLTTTTNAPLANIVIDAANWGTTQEIIQLDSSFKVDSSYQWHIAKDSNGVIKQWCNADLV